MTCRTDGYATRANKRHTGGKSAESVDEDCDEPTQRAGDVKNKSSPSTWCDEELGGLQ